MIRSTHIHPLSVGYPLCHKNIRLAQTIRVWDDADDHKSTFLVELKGMSAQIADGCNMWPDIRLEINTAERGHIGLIVAAQQDSQAAALPHLHLQIRNKGTPYFVPLRGGSHDEGMYLLDPRIGC